jgi:hypothetical protein
MKDTLNKWLMERANLSASLAAGIVHPDKTVFTHFYSRSFAAVLKENVWPGLAEMARIAVEHKLPDTYVRWLFQNAFVYGSVRPDGACALIIASRNLSKEDGAALETLLHEFQGV